MALRSPAALLMEPFASRTTTADDDGDAVLHLVPGTWDFAAVAEGFLPATLSQRAVKRETSFTVALESAVAIGGRVHRDGAGVAHALVEILEGEPRTRHERAVVTDEDGAFEIGGLSPGPYRVSIFHEEQMIRRIVETQAPAKLDVALPPAGTLRMRVVDAATGEPVRHFYYAIGLPAETESDTYQRDTSSEDGTVTATLTAGTYTVMAVAQGYTPPQPVEVRVKESEQAEVTIALDRGITVTGRVLDENHGPLPGAAVYVEGSGGHARRADPGLSGADGSFTITGIVPGSAYLVVRKDGFVPLRRPLPVETTTSVEVQLTRGLSLEGIVRRGGKPVAGVQVDAVTAGAGGSRQLETSDANGRFVLRGLVPARYTVSAYTEGANTQADNVDPARTRELVLSLDPKPTGVLHGTVTGIPPTLGGKITRRAVFVQGTERGVDGTIDESGHYRIENAPAGVVFVTAQLESTSASRWSQRKRVEIVPGQELRLDLDLGGTYTVRGRVTHDAKPIAGVRVVFANETGLAGSATSRADGTYEVALSNTGTYQIFADSEALPSDRAQVVREIRGGETVDLELREQNLEGTVVDAMTREPLEDVHVTLVPENAPGPWYASEVLTDRSGRFRLLTAASDAHRVVAWKPGYAHRTQLVQLGATRHAPIAIELAKTNDLRVRAIDAKNGTPLNAHIVIAGTDGTVLPVQCTRADDGVSHLCSLAPGKYRLTVVVQGYADRTVEVTAPGSVDVVME